MLNNFYFFFFSKILFLIKLYFRKLPYKQSFNNQFLINYLNKRDLFFVDFPHSNYFFFFKILIFFFKKSFNLLIFKLNVFDFKNFIKLKNDQKIITLINENKKIDKDQFYNSINFSTNFFFKVLNETNKFLLINHFHQFFKTWWKSSSFLFLTFFKKNQFFFQFFSFFFFKVFNFEIKKFKKKIDFFIFSKFKKFKKNFFFQSLKFFKKNTFLFFPITSFFINYLVEYIENFINILLFFSSNQPDRLIFLSSDSNINSIGNYFEFFYLTDLTIQQYCYFYIKKKTSSRMNKFIEFNEVKFFFIYKYCIFLMSNNFLNSNIYLTNYIGDFTDHLKFFWNFFFFSYQSFSFFLPSNHQILYCLKQQKHKTHLTNINVYENKFFYFFDKNLFFKKNFLKKLFKKNNSSSTVSKYYYFYFINFFEQFFQIKIYFNFVFNFKFSAIFIFIIKYLTKKYFSFQIFLGKGFFLNEMLIIILFMIKYKDIIIFKNWLKINLERIYFQKHKNFFSKFKIILLELLNISAVSYHIKGFCLIVRGKISAAGNSRKRCYRISFGLTSFSDLSYKINYTKQTIRTKSGILGITIFLSYF